MDERGRSQEPQAQQSGSGKDTTAKKLNSAFNQLKGPWGIVLGLATLASAWIGWESLRHTPDPAKQRIFETCSSARDLQVNVARAEPEQKVEQLEALARAANRADEELYHLALAALDAYQAANEAEGRGDDPFPSVVTMTHALYTIDDACRRKGVELIPEPDARACAYTLPYYLEAHLMTSGFTEWTTRSNPRLEAAEDALLEKAREADSPEIRTALTKLPQAFQSSAQNHDATALHLSLYSADLTCRSKGVEAGTSVPDLSGATSP